MPSGYLPGPGTRTYQVMTAVAYYSGLRPSEVVMLRPRALELPEEGGWGVNHVLEADDDGYDEPAEPKTGERAVPAPPVLVDLLRAWFEAKGAGPAELLFRTCTGRRPVESNWRRGREPADRGRTQPSAAEHSARAVLLSRDDAKRR